MPGESQAAPASRPDPSVLTTEQMLLAIENLEKLTEAERLGKVAFTNALIEGLRRELITMEEHRKELKADSKEALSTAMIAAEKAVQAALAAAEKARDQQTIAQQLATNKAEVGFAEALAQLNATFSVAIANVVDGLNEAKASIAELRSLRRGGKEAIAAIYAFAGFLAIVVSIVGVYVATGR